MVYIVVFGVYIALMVAIGMYFSNKNENMSDYILGGRSLNIWVASLSAQASDMSGWLLTGLPGLAYLSAMGTQEAIWTALGLAIGTYCNWKIVAKRLRQYTQIAGNALTMPDYFEQRFRDTSRTLRIITALFILVFFLVYTSSAFVTAAKLFQTVFDLDYFTGLLIGAVIVVAYTCLGGFKAVCWTDLFQGLLMFFAIVIIPFAAVKSVGSLDTTIDIVNQTHEGFLNIIPNGENISWFVVITGIGWGAGYFGQPHILARFMAIRTSKEVKPARWIAMIWVMISLTSAILVGIFGVAYLNPPLAEGAHETVFMTMAMRLFPPVIAAILLSAILAATMSTADSQLLVTASSISEDVYKAFIKPSATDKELLRLSKITVVVVAVIAVVIGINPDSSIFNLVSYAWSGFGSAFGPAILLSLYWRRMTRKGAIAGVITGGIVSLVWGLLGSLGGIFTIYEIVPGILASIAAIVIFSLKDAPPPKEIISASDIALNKFLIIIAVSSISYILCAYFGIIHPSF